MHSRDIALAKAASDFITSIKGHDKAVDIRKELEALPARIRINGLTQTMLFLLAKGKGKENEDRNRIGKELTKHLKDGLVDEAKYPSEACNLCKNESLKKNTEKAVAYSAWLKRFAKAEIEKEKEKDNLGETDE